MLAAERYDGAEPVNLGVGPRDHDPRPGRADRRADRLHGRDRWDATKPDGQPRRALDTSRRPRAVRLRGADDVRGRAAAHDRLVRGSRSVGPLQRAHLIESEVTSRLMLVRRLGTTGGPLGTFLRVQESARAAFLDRVRFQHLPLGGGPRLPVRKRHIRPGRSQGPLRYSRWVCRVHRVWPDANDAKAGRTRPSELLRHGLPRTAHGD